MSTNAQQSPVADPPRRDGLVLDDSFRLISSVRYDQARTWLAHLSPGSTGHDDAPILLPTYHKKRLIQAAVAFEWYDAAKSLDSDDAVARIVSVVEDSIRASGGEPSSGSSGVSSPFRARVLLGSDGHLKASAAAIPAFPSPLSSSHPEDVTSTLYPSSLTPATIPGYLASFPAPFDAPVKLLLDTQPTPSSLFTAHKTTKRDHYDAARTRVGLSNPPNPAKDGRAEVLLWNDREEITEGSIRNISFWQGDGGKSEPNRGEPNAGAKGGKWVTPKLDSGCLNGAVRLWLLETGRVEEGTLLKSDLKDGMLMLLSNGVEGCTIGRLALA